MGLLDGDTVRLKSGGPLMMVRKLEPDEWLATWSDSEGNIHRHVFSESMLIECPSQLTING